MEREEESICCQEVDAVRNKILEDVMEEQLQAEPRCICSIQGLRQCASMSGFCRQLGYNTSSSMALLLMRGLNIRKTATLLTGNWSVGVGVLWAKISASLCLLVL